MTEAMLILIGGSLIVGSVDALLHRIRGRRYRGRTYDPQRPVIQRAGASRIGWSGRICHFCETVTYGQSDRCGKCHRLPVHLPVAPTEPKRLPFVAAESSLFGAPTTSRFSAQPSSSSSVPSRGSGVGASARDRDIS